jgi:hypothetical protein
VGADTHDDGSGSVCGTRGCRKHSRTNRTTNVSSVETLTVEGGAACHLRGGNLELGECADHRGLARTRRGNGRRELASTQEQEAVGDFWSGSGEGGCAVQRVNDEIENARGSGPIVKNANDGSRIIASSSQCSIISPRITCESQIGDASSVILTVIFAFVSLVVFRPTRKFFSTTSVFTATTISVCGLDYAFILLKFLQVRWVIIVSTRSNLSTV